MALPKVIMYHQSFTLQIDNTLDPGPQSYVVFYAQDWRIQKVQEASRDSMRVYARGPGDGIQTE